MLVETDELFNNLRKSELANFEQKVFLGDKHQERFLQKL
jgi:hypothetical protein